MNLTDAEIDKIIENNCGNPPEVEKLKYHIWLNNWKLDFYSKSRTRLYKSSKEHEECLDSYKRLVSRAQAQLRLIQNDDGQLTIFCNKTTN